VWFKRLLRLWLVVLLPLGAYSTYRTYESHQGIAFWQDNAAYWSSALQKINAAGGALSPEATDARRLIGEAWKARDQLRERRDLLMGISSVLILAPAIVWLTGRVWVWIWRGKA
jgi:hypothetical protein